MVPFDLAVDRAVRTFPKSISPKVIGMTQLEFEHAIYAVTVLHVRHDAAGTPNNDIDIL